MIQRELLNEIMRLGNDISRNRIFNSTNPTYIVDGDSVIEWFEQIKNFILSETDRDLKIRLEYFIGQNQQYLSPIPLIIDENKFEEMRSEFRESIFIKQ